MSDLITFFRARLDDEERVANACADEGSVGRLAQYAHDLNFLGSAEHVERHEPERVLREVEAKRRILELHAPVADGSQSGWAWFAGSESASERIIRLLALPYADHPDYRAEWKP